MSVSWVIIGVMFLLCYSHLPSAEEQDILHVPVINSSTKLVGEDEFGDEDESDRMSDAIRLALNKRSKKALVVNDDISRVAPNRASTEISALLGHRTVLVSSLGWRTWSEVEKSSPQTDQVVYRSCCHRLCSASRRMCIRLLWGISMLVWEEIVLLLYAIFIMTFCEMTVQVRNSN